MAVNDRVLVLAQTAPAENGLYIWNGAAVAMTRALDASTFPELEQAIVAVEEGTNANTTYRQTAVNGTLGTTAATWVTFGVAAPAATTSTAGIAALATQAEVDTGVVTNKIVTPETMANWSGRSRKFSQTFGDGSATQFTITHNLNTRDLSSVTIFRNSGAFDEVNCDIERTTVNSVTLRFSSAPGVNAFRAVIRD
jgi:hypothetical protein